MSGIMNSSHEKNLSRCEILSGLHTRLIPVKRELKA